MHGNNDGTNRSHIHLGQIRNAGAEHYIQKVSQESEGLPRCRHKAIEISFDETEVPMHLDNANALVSLMMLHCTETEHWRSHFPVVSEFVLILGPIAGTSSRILVPTLFNRLFTYLELEDGSRYCGRASVVVNTDSAPACISAARAVGDYLVASKNMKNASVIHGQCQTHHLINLIVDLLKANK